MIQHTDADRGKIVDMLHNGIVKGMNALADPSLNEVERNLLRAQVDESHERIHLLQEGHPVMDVLRGVVQCERAITNYLASTG